IGWELAELHLVEIVVLRQECSLQVPKSLAPVMVHGFAKHRLRRAHPHFTKCVVIVSLEFSCRIKMLFRCAHGYSSFNEIAMGCGITVPVGSFGSGSSVSASSPSSSRAGSGPVREVLHLARECRRMCREVLRWALRTHVVVPHRRGASLP